MPPEYRAVLRRSTLTRMDEKRDQNVTVRLTAEEVRSIDQQATLEGRDRSGLIRWAIQQYLNQKKDDR